MADYTGQTAGKRFEGVCEYINDNCIVLPLQTISTDTITDINVTAPIPAPLFGNTIIANADITINNSTEIKILKGGFIRVTGNIPYREVSPSNNVRFAPEFRIRKNGAVVPSSPKWRGTYVRDASGSNEGSTEIAGYTFEVTANDLISFQVARISGVNGVMVLDGAVLEIEFIKYTQ